MPHVGVERSGESNVSNRWKNCKGMQHPNQQQTLQSERLTSIGGTPLTVCTVMNKCQVQDCPAFWIHIITTKIHYLYCEHTGRYTTYWLLTKAIEISSASILTSGKDPRQMGRHKDRKTDREEDEWSWGFSRSIGRGRVELPQGEVGPFSTMWGEKDDMFPFWGVE